MKVTNPDKLLFTDPPITKGEIIKYYDTIATRILPYLRERALSLVVCPQGIKSECFYKKNPAPIIISSAADLLATVQNNTIEFHTWGSTATNIEKPDIMVFDLDPDEGLGLKEVRQGVHDLKSILDELGVISFLKTSGNKGYHIVVPFKPSVDWNTFRNFAKTVAIFMEKKWPSRYTSNVRKAERRGKIFVDWIRNTRAATSIAPYSLRAKAGARISLPIAWNKLNIIKPNSITMQKAVACLKDTDPWADFFKVSQQLTSNN